MTGVDVNIERLRSLHFSGTLNATLASSPVAIGEILERAELVIGTALVPGARAPVVASAKQVHALPKGSVVVDLAIDQGGCIETSPPTSLSHPNCEDGGVIHYCVTNVPGQFPRTACRALSAAITPPVRQLALDPTHAMLEGLLNLQSGRIVHPFVSAALATSA